MKSPIKYFGGKGVMANKILQYFPNDYRTLTYVEPFCGSAALLFHKEPSPIEIINDLNQNVHALFLVLINPKYFIDFKTKCDLTLYTEDLRSQYRQDLKKELPIVERAYKFFIVNRTSRNGIGGFSVSQTIRRNMSKSVSDYLSAIDGLFQVHDRLSKVIIHNRDALELIKKWDRDDCFLYLDPPYALETRSSGGYDIDMNDKDQNNLLDILINVKNAKILVSGYKCARYEVLEKHGYVRVDFAVHSHTGTYKSIKRTESLWYNYENIE